MRKLPLQDIEQVCEQCVKPMIQTRRTLVWLFTTLAGLFGVIGAVWIWTSQHHRQKLSVADKFYMAAQFPSTYDYEIAAEIMRPIAEAGDVNAQVNLAVALHRMNTRKALKDRAVPDRDEELIPFPDHNDLTM